MRSIIIQCELHLTSTSLQFGRGHSLYKEKEAVRISLSLRFSSIASIRSMIYRNNENCTSIPLTLHVGRGRSSYKENGRKCSSCASTSIHFLPFSLQFSLFFAQKKPQNMRIHALRQKKKHETGFEPAALALARRCSTTEPLVRISYVLWTNNIILCFKRNVNTFFEKN